MLAPVPPPGPSIALGFPDPEGIGAHHIRQDAGGLADLNLLDDLLLGLDRQQCGNIDDAPDRGGRRQDVRRTRRAEQHWSYRQSVTHRGLDQIEGNVFEYDYVYVKVNTAFDIMGIDHVLKQGNVMNLEDLKFFIKLESLFLNSTIIDTSIDYTVLKSMPALIKVVVNNEPLTQ